MLYKTCGKCGTQYPATYDDAGPCENCATSNQFRGEISRERLKSIINAKTFPPIHGKFLMLIKAQVLREMGTCFPSSMDSDYANYLKGLERATIEAITNEGAMDRYLRESRRLTLEEWLDTLDWGHCTR